MGDGVPSVENKLQVNTIKLREQGSKTDIYHWEPPALLIRKIKSRPEMVRSMSVQWMSGVVVSSSRYFILRNISELLPHYFDIRIETVRDHVQKNGGFTSIKSTARRACKTTNQNYDRAYLGNFGSTNRETQRHSSRIRGTEIHLDVAVIDGLL